MKDGKRIGFFGSSGCGKTYALFQFLKRYENFIFVDPKREFDYKARRFNHAESFRSALFSLKKQAENGKIHLVFYPENAAAADHFLNWLFENIAAEILIIVDECQEVCPSGTASRNPDNALLKIARLGRSRGISLAIASQRIKTVDISLRSNLNSMLLFRQGDFSDAQEVKKMTGKDLFNLAPRKFILRQETGNLKEYSDVKKVLHWF